MTQYDFWFAPLKGAQFCCTVAQHEGNYRECLEAAALTWEALLPFGNPVTRHPTTWETPEEFRAKHMELSAEAFYSRMPPKLIAELYVVIEQLFTVQEGPELVETYRISGVLYSELVLRMGAEGAHECIREARLNT